MTSEGAFNNKRVLITGHTGFKGAWLCLRLLDLGARVSGYSLQPPTEPNLFSLLGLEGYINHRIGDVRNEEGLYSFVDESKPEIVFHMAAQSLVRTSYKDPKTTYETNVMGTVNLFEALRKTTGVRAIINITSDKCYDNKGWVWGYRENDPLGGFDPYSSSKACSELVTSAYRNSFFHPDNYAEHGVGVASARAGNVIGGGDWAEDRLIPDCIRAFLKGEGVMIRNPNAVRPWQHVLEPLSGYLTLAQKLLEDGTGFSGAWNFGPELSDSRPVEWLVKRLCDKWGGNASYSTDMASHPHEAHSLRLDCSKAGVELGWHPRWNLEKAVDAVVEWTRAYEQGLDLKDVCLRQIEEYGGPPA